MIAVEELGDFDGILYHKCEECWHKKNAHTGVEFYSIRKRGEYLPAYQFDTRGRLVWYSRYKAEWLWLNDDLNEGNNLLWWGRGKGWKDDLVFRPIKDLEIAHIKAIIVEWHTRDREYLNAFIERLSSILTIIPKE